MHVAIRRLVPAAAVLAVGWLTVPAAAAPIFGTATVSPDAISPNGDDIQDLTVVTYQITADSANVRILLAVAGGSVVDTLQIFTRQGAGVHAIPFDGSTKAGPVADGNYEIRIFGVGTQGEGSESRVLPLLVDRVAPVISQWTLSAGTSATLQNGDVLSLQACVGADAETVLVDLSALDSNFDPALVNENPLPPTCRLFTYTISAANTRVDDDAIPARAEALDRAGNRGIATLFLCLSNHPPQVTEPGFLRNESPYLRNGDEIQMQVGFGSLYPLRVTADLSNLDSRFDPDSVRVAPLGGGRYDVRYRIRSGNTRPDATYSLRLEAYDPGCGVAVDSTATMILDNAGFNSALIDSFRVEPTAFSPAGDGYKQVRVRFIALVDSVIVNIYTRAVLQSPAETTIVAVQPSRPFTRGPQTVVWDGTYRGFPAPDRYVEQDLTLTLRATSVALDRERVATTILEVDHTKPQLRGFPQPGQVSVRNGRIVNLPLTYDQAGYTLRADWSAVDSNFNPGSSTVFADSSNGKYGIFYSLSPTNTTLDGIEIPVPVIAYDRAGNPDTVTNLITVCLDNLPPHLVSAQLLENPGPFRNGDRILIETHWDSEPQQKNIVVSADFSAVDDRWNPTTRPATVINRGNGRYDISYTISTQNSIPGGTDLPVRVTARDAATEGCGSTTVTAVVVDLDSKAGSAPTFDAVDPVVRDPLFTLSGIAAGSDSVEIMRSGAAVDTFFVDPTTDRFQGVVTLLPGNNDFTARGFDLAGNVSPVSGVVEVFLATSTFFEVPPAFHPGSEFFLVLLEPADAVVLRIYTLEGVEVQRLEGGPGDLYHIPWDGRDHTGSLLSSGPCLAAVEIEEAGNIRERLHKAFIFTQRGGTP